MLRERLSATVRAIVLTARSSQLSFLAASIAYFLVLGLVPLGLLAFVGASLLGGEAFAEGLVESAGAVLSPEAAALLAAAARSGVGLSGVTVASALVLGWSGLRVFRGLAIAFATVYDTDPGSLRSQLRDGLVALAAVGLAVVAVTGLAAFVTVADLPLAEVVGAAGLLGALAVVFLPLYYVLPRATLTVRQALPGAVVAAVGWTVLGATFAAYAAVAADSAVFAVLGGVVLLLAWCYVASLVLLAGATVNAALAGERPDRHTQGTAVRTPETMGTAGDSEDEDGATGRDGATEGDPLPDGGGDGAGEGDPAADDGADDVDAGEPSADDGASAASSFPSDVGAARRHAEDVAELREEIEELQEELDERSTQRDDLERDLRRYVRGRVRRGHAHGWGPYLVLAYGTAMTLGAFYFLDNGWAILAMIVIWLSTLGLYALMVIVGLGATVLGIPGRVRDAIGRLR